MSSSRNRSSGSGLTVALAALAWITFGAGEAAGQTGREQFHYLQHCSGCHQLDGSGVPPDVPNLRHDLGLLLKSPEGRDFILRVPGVVGVPITAPEVADLLNWMIRSYYPGMEGFVPFTVDEIESGRARPLYDPLSYREEFFPDLY